MRLTPADASAAFTEIERLKANFRAIETLGKPVVSLINGTALGGGWEVALVGHHRIAIDDKKIQLGMPEVTLGLLPGACGVTKMTRHLGLMGAQPYLVEGKTFSPAEAKGMGLVHDLVPPGPNAAAEMRAKGLAWIAANPSAQHPWEAKGYKVPGGLPSSPAVAQMLAVAPAVIKKQTRGLYPAPEAIMACMVEGLQVDMETALRLESRALAKLMTDSQAKAMINTFFFNLNAIKSGTSRPKSLRDGRTEEFPRYKPAKVGLLGAGMMGAGIAYAQASKGIATVLKDVSQEKADTGKGYAAKITQARVDKGRMKPDAQAEILARIQPTGSVDDLKGCDLIIEAVFENRELKARVTQESEPMLSAERLLCLQHLHLAHQRPGHGVCPRPKSSSASTSSARWTR
jgi:3-hydroxyacyl-CoA dehydrogenase/enoyl-CoA hydratase/3-hydroxybutyryl-CoA epimerase